MSGETNLSRLIQGMEPQLHPGQYVFTTVTSLAGINRADTICEFKEAEGHTVILEKNKADKLGLPYDYIASWLTLKIHSALNATGFTARFATELAEHNISCNVIAGYYHDHIFVEVKDGPKALLVLQAMAAGE